MPFDKVLTQANNNSYWKQPLNPHLLNLRSYGATPIIHLPFIIKFEPSAFKLVSLVAFCCNIWTRLLLIMIALTIYAWRGLNTPIIFAILPTNALRAKNLNFSASGIYRWYHITDVRGLQYMPPRVLALWGQNPAGAINCINSTRHDVSDVLGLFQTLRYSCAERIKDNR
jgi:hypothetical protein